MSLASAFRLAINPARFAEAAGITPDPWQHRLLTSTAPRILVNITRQGGKSTTAAILALHEAIYTPGALILLLSPSLRQSSELFRKVLDVYRGLGRPVAAEAETKLQLELANNSRVVSLPGTEGTIRGFSGVRLLIVDEASRVEDSLYHAVLPMLAISNGRLAVLSTPHGTRGFYYEAYKQRYGWDYYEVPATECPRISAEFLEEAQRSLGSWWFKQEFCCQFLESETSVFAMEDIEAAFEAGGPAWRF